MLLETIIISRNDTKVEKTLILSFSVVPISEYIF